MIFINDRKLARHFRDNAVPAKEQFWYLLLTLLLLGAAHCSFFPQPAILAPWNLYVDIMNLAFTVLVTAWCYKTNKSGDDKDFIGRFISLNLPISIQMGILMGLLGVAIGPILGSTFPLAGEALPAEEILRGPIALGLVIVGRLYVLWRLDTAFKIASGGHHHAKKR